MKTKLHNMSISPLILLFSTFLKGKKKEYTNFFVNKKTIQEQKEILKVNSKSDTFFDNIKFFFDKQSPIYDKTLVSFNINISKKPEEKSFIFDFFKIISVYHAMSMLSAKIPNENIEVQLAFKKSTLNDSQINHLLRYALLAFASKKVEKLYFNEDLISDEKSSKAYKTMIEYLNNSSIINFSNAKSLYVITCKKGKDTFDIVWSSQNDIELTEADKVYDKYGKLLSKDAKITNSPIYAFHK